MIGGINIDVPPMSVGGPSVPVNLSEAFSKGANGPMLPGNLSFDGKLSESDAVAARDSVVDPARLSQAVQQIASFVQNLSRSLSISVDDRSGDFVVRVQNALTEEVVRQIPSEEVLRISAAIEERNSSLSLMGERGAGSLLLDVVA